MQGMQCVWQGLGSRSSGLGVRIVFLFGFIACVSSWCASAEVPSSPSHTCVGWYQGSPLYCSQGKVLSPAVFSLPEGLERFVPDKYKRTLLKQPPTEAFYFSLRFSAPAGQSSFWSDRFKLPILFESSVPNSQQALYFLGAFTQQGYARKQRLYMQKSLRKIQPEATLDMVQFRKDKGFVWVLGEGVAADLIASQPLLKVENQPMLAKQRAPKSSIAKPASKPTSTGAVSQKQPRQTVVKAAKQSPATELAKPTLKRVALAVSSPKVATKQSTKTQRSGTHKPKLQPVSYDYSEIFAIRLISYKTSVDWRSYLKRLTNKYFTQAKYPQPTGSPPYCRKTPKNSIFVYAQIHEDEATLNELLATRPDWKRQGAYVAKLRDVSLQTCTDIMASI